MAKQTATLQDRLRKEKKPTPTEAAIASISGKKKDKKYIINVVYHGDQESEIKARAAELGIGVATYVKMLIAKDLKDNQL